MAKFVVKRVIMAAITVLIVACITFFLMNAVPGNPWLSEKTPPQSVIDALNEKYGLDKPVPVQLAKYLGTHSVTVSRIMAKMKQLGYMAKDNRGIILKQPEALREFLKGDKELNY